MGDDKKKALTPKLRFPEFRDANGWTEKKLSDISPAVFDGTHQTPKYTTEGVPFFSVENIVSGAKNKFISHVDYVVATNKNKPDQDDVLLTRIGKIGFSQVVTWDFPFSIYVTLAVIKKSPLFYSQYLHHFLQSERYQAEIHKRSLLNAVPCKINMDSLRATLVLLPELSEQEKIANCLTSLDELIAAQGRKVEALKVHKKGLMQQLFPREGETLPRLRFPEFRDAPEWEIKPLSRIAENLDNKRVPVTESERAKGAIPYYGASGIVDYVKDYIFDEDLLCVSEDGANLVARTYPIAFSISGRTWVNNHAHVLRFDSLGTQKLVEVYLNAIDLGDFITGMAQPKLNRAMLDTIPIPLPKPEEQQQIADCLRALDAQIAAEVEKLEVLKIHKRGLMQQLFPSPAETTA